MIILNPTHVELTILQGNRLITKEKNGTNNAYVTVSMGKDQYQTELLKNSNNPFVWKDQTFLLEIPTEENVAVIYIFVYHKPNNSRRIAIQKDDDDLLGSTYISLKELQPTSDLKLMILPLSSKSTDSISKSGEIVVSIQFRSIVFYNMRDIGEEIIMENNNNTKKKRTSSLRSIAQSLMNDRKKRSSEESVISSDSGSRRTSAEVSDDCQKKSKSSSLRSIVQALMLERKIQYATPVKDDNSLSQKTSEERTAAAGEIRTNGSLSVHAQDEGVDRNENVIHTRLTRVESARGKTNTRKEISDSNRSYIVKKVSSRICSSSSSESETESEENKMQPPTRRVNSAPVFKQEHQQQHLESNINEEDDVPLEFRPESKKNLADMIYQLRKLSKLQEQKIQDLEDYIDGRLAEVMARNPLSLEV